MTYEIQEERPRSTLPFLGLPWSVYVTTEDGERTLAAAFLTKADAEAYRRQLIAGP